MSINKETFKRDTYEYKKVVKRPTLDVDNVEIGTCSKKVLMNDLKKPFNGRFYHTSDTNEFFFDWDDKRFQLNVLGSPSDFIDLSIYAKKNEIPTKLSQLINDSKFITLSSLSDFLNDNEYITFNELKDALSDFVGIDEFDELVDRVEKLEDVIEQVNDIQDTYEKVKDISDNFDEIKETFEEVKEISKEFEDLKENFETLNNKESEDTSWAEFNTK